MSTLTFGIQTGEKFRIEFDYYARGRLYSGEFQSPVAIAQGERVELSYNPLNPNENSRSSGSAAGLGRSSLLAAGVAGSVVLSLVWLALMRGCR